MRILEKLDLARFTDNTITDLAALEDELKSIRKRGYAINNQEFHEGIISVAVPIIRGERVIAGLAMHAPLARLSIDQAAVNVPVLNRYAEGFAADFAWENQ